MTLLGQRRLLPDQVTGVRVAGEPRESEPRRSGYRRESHGRAAGELGEIRLPAGEPQESGRAAKERQESRARVAGEPPERCGRAVGKPRAFFLMERAVVMH